MRGECFTRDGVPGQHRPPDDSGFRGFLREICPGQEDRWRRGACLYTMFLLICIMLLLGILRSEIQAQNRGVAGTCRSFQVLHREPDGNWQVSSLWPRVSQHDGLISRQGAFGQVRLATSLATKKVYAVKVADVRARTTDPNHTPISTKRRNTIQREIAMWTLASQAAVPEITKLVEPWATDRKALSTVFMASFQIFSYVFTFFGLHSGWVVRP